MKNDQYVAEALAALKPGKGWTFKGDNLSTLVCDDGVTTAPTADEINTWIANNP